MVIFNEIRIYLKLVNIPPLLKGLTVSSKKINVLVPFLPLKIHLYILCLFGIPFCCFTFHKKSPFTKTLASLIVVEY